jgi:hypothetical protein
VKLFKSKKLKVPTRPFEPRPTRSGAYSELWPEFDWRHRIPYNHARKFGFPGFDDPDSDYLRNRPSHL